MRMYCTVIAMTMMISLSLPAQASNGPLFKQEQISKSGRIPNDGIKPIEGFVPNAAIAIGIAIVILDPIYGVDEIEKQKPFTAELRGRVWVVQGSMAHSTGVAEVNISRRTGAILRVIHGK